MKTPTGVYESISYDNMLALGCFVVFSSAWLVKGAPRNAPVQHRSYRSGHGDFRYEDLPEELIEFIGKSLF